MSTSGRRSTIAVLLGVSIVVAALVGGGAAGQTATEPQPTETATPPEEEDDEPPTESGAVTLTGTETATETETPADGTYDQDSSFLRFAHVSPDAPVVDVIVDGERVLTNVSFGEVSDYLTLPSGNHTVTITPAGDDESTVFEGDLTLTPRSTSTLFAAGEVDENALEPFGPILYEDDPFRPADDEAAVSVAHMSPDAPAVDVTADDGSVVLAENLTFEEASQYVTVPAGDLTVEIRPATAENDGAVVATANVSFEGGTAYSAIAAGYLNEDESADGEAFRVVLADDASKTVHLPSTGSDDPGTNESLDGTPTGSDGDETPTETEESIETVQG